MSISDDDYLKYFQEGYLVDEKLWGETSSFIYKIPLPVIPESGRRLTAIDVGCGQGRNIPHLVNAGYDVFAIDILPEAIQSISKKYSKHVTPILADAVEYISLLEPESVNLVLANQVIQNFKTIQKLEQFISSAKRIIRLDGIIALAYFVKPRSLHPKIVRENALILSKNLILTQYFNNGNFKEIYSRKYIKNDYHDGGRPHRHAIEQVIVKRIK